MSAEALKAYQQYMGGSVGSNDAQQQQQQQQQQGQLGQQPGAHFQNPYAAAAGFGAPAQQVPQGMQNPYAAQQQYLQTNPVSKADPLSFPPPYTYPLHLSKLSTALVPPCSTNTQQFARAHVPPAAPTPPPAVPQTPASHAALAQHGQLQPYTPQGPPIPPHARSQGYVDLPRSYNTPQQSPFPGEWQYSQPGQPPSQLGYNNAPAMATTHVNPAYQPRDWSFESTRESNRSRYSGPWPPPDVLRVPSPQLPGKDVFPPPDVPPLALCHVCSVCGQMRSAGYHRHHPIIPAQALISTPCRRCKKRARKAKERREKERRRQEEREASSTITIKIDDAERRGRTRGREDYRHHSLSPERGVYRSSVRANVGLGDSTRVEYRTSREISPERSPPPALRRRTRSEVRFSSVSPPADGVRVRYRRDEDYERQHSPSPDARSRLAAHPTPFRTFAPTNMPGYCPEETRSPPPAPPRGILKTPSQFYDPPPSRHVMETSYDSMLPEVGGNRVQFGGEPRPSEHVKESHSRCLTCRGDQCICDDEYAYHNRRRYHYQRGHVEEIPSPELPTQRFEQLRVREESPPRPYIRDKSHPRRREVDELHFRQFHSDSGHDIREWRENAASQLPPAVDDRGRTRYPRAEPRREASPLRRATSQIQDLGQRIRRRFSRSQTPPPNRKHEDWDDATDSGSEVSGEHYMVKYRKVDENGRYYTVYEERVRKALPACDRMPVGPSARGGFEGPAITRGFAPVRER
ncbi:hypothetical protein P171DRAFT_474646 [Karstenula rhodostoma CBS 690.94]|uniref:Uncharacterized protein n=1 Tax=Karstenula rhodostoma CBS 690.94 TaxID=1392251 RepID=A0A9P4PDW7_9PLEO|nr:hypothetical protein P171DRAFT_474646 [Karstenula rhodostoma CBS 690.94]